MSKTLTEADFAFLRALRARGFAVTLFTPSEVGQCAPTRVEEAMIQAGNFAIEVDAGHHRREALGVEPTGASY